jgi:hypothetical protein
MFGDWLDPVDGEGLGLVLFETAEQVERVKPTPVQLIGLQA